MSTSRIAGRIAGRMAALIALAVALAGAVSAPMTTQAAVRRCGPVVTSGIASAKTEIEAKTKAMAEWRAKALANGPGFDSWRLAHNKILKCLPATTGFECVAMAAPCLIDQTPGSPLKPPAAKI